MSQAARARCPASPPCSPARTSSRLTSSLVVGVKAPLECWPIAVDRVRYVGEPVAVVVARDRYLAEDALDLIEVEYEPLPAVVDPVGAARARTRRSCMRRSAAMSRASAPSATAIPSAPSRRRRIASSSTMRYPAQLLHADRDLRRRRRIRSGRGRLRRARQFQGPFSIHAVMARALKVPGNRLRLRTPPDSGGSFGVKQGVFPYIVLIAAAARVAGRPVKWIEDRLEHLAASVSATNRVTTLEAAVEADGRITALDWDQIEDCGAHLRAPEPATLYRMHGNLTGAYDIRHVAVRNRVVLTNKTPTGLNRGFGGPQVYYRARAADAAHRDRT